MRSDSLNIIMINTIVVMTSSTDRKEVWRSTIHTAIREAKSFDLSATDIDLFNAVLDIL